MDSPSLQSYICIGIFYLTKVCFSDVTACIGTRVCTAWCSWPSSMYRYRGPYCLALLADNSQQSLQFFWALFWLSIGQASWATFANPYNISKQKQHLSIRNWKVISTIPIPKNIYKYILWLFTLFERLPQIDLKCYTSCHAKISLPYFGRKIMEIDEWNLFNSSR